jgi:hypothetical protein
MSIDAFDGFLAGLNGEDLVIDVARETARQDLGAGEDPPDGYFEDRS